MLSGLTGGKPQKKVASIRKAGTNQKNEAKIPGSSTKHTKGNKNTSQNKSGSNLENTANKMGGRGSGILARKLSGIMNNVEGIMEDEAENDAQQTRIHLTEKEQEEDMPPRILDTKNPAAPQVSVHYSYINNRFERTEMVDQLVMHFQHEGETILKDSEEYKIMEEIIDERKNMLKVTVTKFELMDSNMEYDDKTAKRIMKNKFNFNVRQSQTPILYIKERGVSTARPQQKILSWEVNQAWIYDLYYDHFIKHVREDDDPKKKKGAPVEEKKAEPTKKAASIYSHSFKRCLKIMERMIVQNEEQDKYSDYKYMFTQKDKTDPQHRSKEKNIYPQWRFLYPPNKKKNVTSICWNPRYPDMFAVGFGTYDFGKKKTAGSICLFTVKNTNYPEMILQTDDSVMSIDWHPKAPALLAVGLYDGVVQVYDVRNRSKFPVYKSSVRQQKHTDPVWQVMWNPDIKKHFNFYSISSDGRVMNWILMKDKLEPEEVVKLKLINKKNKQSDEETALISLACGLCFDFNKFDPFTFVVGTEEGNIHKCSKAYSGQYQETYAGHQLAVYKIRWNPFHPRTFISASADWTVKIWDYNYVNPVMSFDLGQAMVDVAWSPFSASVFVALSLEKTYVYDLRIDRHSRIAENKPVKSKCTNQVFSPFKPIILIGDSHGGVNSFKLSQHQCKIFDDPDAVEKRRLEAEVDAKKNKKKKSEVHIMTIEEFREQEKKAMEDCLLLGSMFDRDEEAKADNS